MSTIFDKPTDADVHIEVLRADIDQLERLAERLAKSGADAWTAVDIDAAKGALDDARWRVEAIQRLKMAGIK